MKNIKVFVEMANDGSYVGTTQNMVGVVCSYGESLVELSANIRTAIEDNVKVSAEYGATWVEDYVDFTLSYIWTLK